MGRPLSLQLGLSGGAPEMLKRTVQGASFYRHKVQVRPASTPRESFQIVPDAELDLGDTGVGSTQCSAGERAKGPLGVWEKEQCEDCLTSLSQ